MARQSSLTRFKSILRSQRSSAAKAVLIVKLAPELTEAAFTVMDDAMETADPLVQVAMMDAYFEMTDDGYYEHDLAKILRKAGKSADGEELYMAARLALGRVHGQPPNETLDECVGTGLKISAVRVRGQRRGPVAMATEPEPRDRITIIIHGTWASDGTWWRPGGDFFQYVQFELNRPELYGEKDRFQWSGKNQDAARNEGAADLNQWLRSHPAAEVNIFAHSHGANVAMLATRQGIRIDRLVMLSPPVRDDYFAKWSNVKSAYNIQASFDPVVAIARGGQWFGLPNVKEKRLQASGHSSSHDPGVWRKERLAKFIEIPWA